MNRLIYSASSDNADLFYATRFWAGDPFLYFEKGNRPHIVLNALEYDRGRKEAKIHKVINQSAFIEKMRRAGRKSITIPDWIAAILKQHHLGTLTVAPSFPVGLWNELRKRGVKLTITQKALFPERTAKTKTELDSIRKSLKGTAQLLKIAVETIRSSRPKRNRILMLHGKPLTSERVHSAIQMEAARLGLSAEHPIVAGGVQACDPHERGHGVLRSNELIVLDIFPRDLKTGYWGDMTRTVVKGRASEAQRRQFHAVAKAQKLAIKKLRAGIDGKSVHDAVASFFKQEGYETSNASGRYQGFFHGTGHGLGLEIHESPRVSSVSQKLNLGNVVTVEPGLYYPKVGGVRIEDVVVLEKTGCKLLSHFSVPLEI